MSLRRNDNCRYTPSFLLRQILQLPPRGLDTEAPGGWPRRKRLIPRNRSRRLRAFESTKSSMSCTVPFHVHRRTLIAISGQGTVEWGRRTVITDVPQVGQNWSFVQICSISCPVFEGFLNYLVRYHLLSKQICFQRRVLVPFYDSELVAVWERPQISVLTEFVVSS